MAVQCEGPRVVGAECRLQRIEQRRPLGERRLVQPVAVAGKLDRDQLDLGRCRPGPASEGLSTAAGPREAIEPDAGVGAGLVAKKPTGSAHGVLHGARRTRTGVRVASVVMTLISGGDPTGSME